MAHTLYYTVGPGSFPGVKRTGRGVDHPPLSSAEVKEIIDIYIFFHFLTFVVYPRVNFTSLITPWCRVLLEKLTGLQLVKKFPSISRNPKVHYRTHKRPPPVSILGQPNPVHIPISHLLEIHPNIIHPSTLRSPQWFPSLRFPQQDRIHPPLLTHTLYLLLTNHLTNGDRCKGHAV